MGTGLAGHILRGYLALLRVAAVLGAVMLVAAACGVAITVPLWLLATRATRVYNWLIVVAAAATLGAVAAARLLRGARQAPSAGRYLRTAAAAGAQIAGRAAGVLLLAGGEIMLLARWGTVPGLLALPLVLVLAGILLFVREKTERKS